MQSLPVAMRPQLRGDHMRGRVDMPDMPVQHAVEQPVDERRSAGDIPQRPRRLQNVLRLQVKSGSGGDSHLMCGPHRHATVFERQVHVDHIRALKRLAEHRPVRLCELHLLFRRDPRDQRDVTHANRILGRTNTDQTDRMALPAQLLGILQRRIRRAVALVARGVDHQRDGQRAVGIAIDTGRPRELTTLTHTDIVSQQPAKSGRARLLTHRDVERVSDPTRFGAGVVGIVSDGERHGHTAMSVDFRLVEDSQVGVGFGKRLRHV